MAAALIRVAKLSFVERMAVELIRGARPATPGSDDHRDFAAARREAGRAGLSVSPTGCPYLGADEATLLGYLTLLQRRRALLTLELDAHLQQRLERAADRLAERGLHLSYRNVSRMSPNAAVRPGLALRAIGGSASA